MIKENRGLFRTAGIALLLTMQACTTVPGIQQEGVNAGTAEISAVDDSLSLISADVMHAVLQINSLPVLSAPVHVQQAESEFGKALTNTIDALGIPVTDRLESSSTLSFAHALTIDRNDAIRELSIELHIGEVALKRTYQQVGTALWPSSGLLVRGYDPQHMIVMDELFTHDPAQAVTSLVARVEAQPALFSRKPRSSQALAPNTVPGLKQSRNVSELGRSNYRGLLPNFQRHREETLVFDPDSVKLSSVNATLIKSIVRDSVPGDYFSVLGCSNGPTDIPNGNAILAQDRTQRVASALLYFGISEQRILDESCWADTPLPPLPNRGVVLSVLRDGKTDGDTGWGEYF